MKYYLFEKDAHGGNSYKQYTFDELKKYFNNMELNNIDELKNFIETNINNCEGIHYHDYYIEEV